MTTEDPLDNALGRFTAALDRLEGAIAERQAEAEQAIGIDRQIQRMTADRARLAQELDRALARTERLEGTNQEVSERLVGAMERIRSIIGPDR